MTFNPGQTKQAQELTFSKKTNKIVLAPLCFNNATVKKHTTVWKVSKYGVISGPSKSPYSARIQENKEQK